MMTTKTLAELAKKVNAELRGDPQCIITGIGTLEAATSGQITFLDNPKYRSYLAKTKASAVILNEAEAKSCLTNALVVKEPYYAYALVAEEFSQVPKSKPRIHPSAVIGENCQIHPTASISPHVVIGNNVLLGAQTQIDAGTVIGDNVQIGENCHLWPNVTIYYGVTIGNHVVIHSSAVIGSDGFGWAKHEGQWKKVPQLGSVIIQDNVDIGAGTAIARGAIEDTVIKKGVILDNLIQVAHNVRIGENTAIAGCTGIAGSTEIGKNCIIGGAVGFAGHIKIVDNVAITGMAMITNSIHEPGVYSSGTGFMKNEEWQKNAVRFRHLDEIARRLKRLEEKT